MTSSSALILFDLGGVSVSSGSACSSGKVGRSHVLDAMAVGPALAAGELRWIATPPMRAELARVLGYPLIARRLLRDGRRPEAVLAAFDAGSRTIDSPPPRAPFVCKDADDQMFIDLAVARRARLLSKDRAVLSMRKRLATLGVAVAPSFG